jgi:hypothetical protein
VINPRKDKNKYSNPGKQETPGKFKSKASPYSRSDVPPIKRAIWNLVKFVFREENGREETVYR